MSLQTGESNTRRLLLTPLGDDPGALRSGSVGTRWLRRALPVFTLALVILWASARLRRVETPQAVDLASGAGSVGNAVAGPPGEIVAPPEVATPALNQHLRGLAELRVLYRRPRGGERIETLDSGALRTGRVTVFNLWATYCQPCKEEFPGLDELLSSPDPAKSLEHVDFVPVLVDNSASIEHAQGVYTQLGGPPASAFVADEGLSGGFRQVLSQAGLIDGNLSLPTTLVLDCEARLRWFHRGALTEAKFRELAALLRSLDAEVGSERCPRRRSKKKKKRLKKAGSGAADSPGAADSADSAASADLPDSADSATSADSPGSADSPDSPDSPGSLGSLGSTDSSGEGGAESNSGSGSGSGPGDDSAEGAPPEGCDHDRTCEPQRGESAVTCPTDCRPEISGDLKKVFSHMN